MILAASRTANKGTFTVDAFPKRVFEGTVTQVRQSPQTIQNVVTFDAVVSVDNQRPGAEAGDDRLDTDHHRPKKRRHPRAQSGAALCAGRTCAARGPSRCVYRALVRLRAKRQSLWVLRDGQPVALSVVLGLDDENFTEIVSGDIQPGDQVIVAEETSSKRWPVRSAAAALLRTHRFGRKHEMQRPLFFLIKVENVTKTFVSGDVEVRALRGVNPRG